MACQRRPCSRPCQTCPGARLNLPSIAQASTLIPPGRVPRRCAPGSAAQEIAASPCISMPSHPPHAMRQSNRRASHAHHGAAACRNPATQWRRSYRTVRVRSAAGHGLVGSPVVTRKRKAGIPGRRLPRP